MTDHRPGARGGPRARMTVRIGPDDVGRRVTVRARWHGPEASTTDVVGTLTAWRDGALTIVDRHGGTRRIEVADLVAARVVPVPPPARRRRRGRRDTPGRAAPLDENPT